VPSNRAQIGLSEASDHARARAFPDDAGDLVGVELEFLVVPAVEGEHPSRRQLDDLVLPGGSALSVEPGGQMELSSRPMASVSELCGEVGEDVEALRAVVVAGGGRLLGMGLLPGTPVRRSLSSPRYDAMSAFFGPDGPAGSVMMTSTASVQVNVGLGSGAEGDGRWAVAVSAALVRHAGAGARAEASARQFAGCWSSAGIHGLAHPGLQRAAAECFAAASDVLGDLGAGAELSGAVAEYVDRFVARGRTPADDRLDAFRRSGSILLAEDDARLVAASR